MSVELKAQIRTLTRKARRPARIANHDPFRVQRRIALQTVRVLVSLFLLISAASAATLSVKVVDPQSAPVAGAQIILMTAGSSVPLAVQTSSAEGLAHFRVPDGQGVSVRVLAAGFAQQDLTANASQDVTTVKLRLATASETVVVTATRGLAPEAVSGGNVSVLDGGQLTLINPVDAAEAVRFLPGAVINSAGRRGSLSSLFVRGGDSRYNKVIVDGVPVTDPGGTFDFGVVPLYQADRLELLRGAQSTLYGSDAMTSVVQVWSRTGSTPLPELRFGADGGNFGTADGYLSLAGARGRYDYNLFGNQFNTNGQGVNDQYSNSSQGANLGVAFSEHASLRLRMQHSNNRSGVQSFWDFNGDRLIPPDSDQFARQNNLLGSVELTVSGPSRWQHRFSGFEYHHKRINEDNFIDPGRVSPLFGNIDFPFSAFADLNRAGFDYQGDYVERSWSRSTFGYEFEDENGFFGPPADHGLRRNQAVYAQQALQLKRLSVIAGARFVHNENFGNRGVPRVALSLLALKGGEVLSGTRLRFSYALGIKEPRFEESFAGPPFSIPNLNLRPERNRAFEAGFEQSFFGRKYELSATYFDNLFRDQIDFSCCDANFQGQFVNVNESKAHGAEVELQGRPLSRLSWSLAYNYVSTQILAQPFAFDPLLEPGQQLLRRPRHSGSLLVNYIARRWGANLGGSFVGRRPDSDFLGFGINHADGYGRVDLGGWYSITARITAYVNIENALNNHYNEVAGYPALTANFRAGMRFRLGGE